MKKKLTIGLLAALTLTPVWAEEVDEIVVSATGIPTPISQIGSSVDIITAEDLERQQITYLQDALATVAGVSTYQSGGPGTLSSVFLRGMGSEYTAVFVDGMQINKPGFHGVDWSSLPTHGLETVEVLRGSQGVMFGSEAIGGAINAYTAVGGDTHFKTMADIGSSGTQRLIGSARGELDKIAYGFSLETLSTNGISAANEDNGNTEADSHEKTSARVRLQTDFDDRLSADFAYRYISSETNHDGFVDTDQDGFGDTLADTDDSTYLDASGMSLKLDYAGNAVNHSLSYASSENDYDSSGFVSAGKRRNFGYRGTLDFGDGLKFLIGGDREVENYESGMTEYETSNIAGYTVMQLHTDGVSTSVAARRDDHEEFGSFDTYRLSAILDLEAFALRGTYGTGFRAPSLYQLYAFNNTNLTPEESIGGDIGLVFRLNEQTSIETAYFFAEVTDLIQYQDFQTGYIQSTGENKSSGFELRGETVLFDDYELSGNYTNLTAEDADGDRLSRRPKHTLNVALATDITDRLSVNGSLRLVRDIVGIDGLALENYTLFNANATYRVNEQIKATARVENLLGEDYETARGYGTPGRAFYVGVSSRF